jgi:two-component system, NarL family, nitrate/nitrite response regulator NarL
MSQAFAYRDMAVRVARDSAQPVLVHLICSNVLLRSGLDHILAGTQFSLSDNVYNDHTELPQIGSTDPVLVVCGNCAMNDLEGAVESLRMKCPQARIVIISDDLKPASLARAYKAGIDGVCSTDMNRDVLLKALELIMLGERFIPSSMGLALLEVSPEEVRSSSRDKVVPLHAHDTAPQRLSERETQILRCLIDGASNKHIARQLGVAEATVKVHIKAILRKAKVANRTQAALWAQRQLSRGPVANSD